MNDAPAQSSLAPWFGAKRTMAPTVIQQLGPHRAYWEPFCGSMSILLNKPAVMMETVNDLHGDLVNLAWVIQDPQTCQELYWRLRRTLFAHEVFRASQGVIRSGPVPDRAQRQECVERAYHYFVVSWMGIGGVAGTPNYHHGFARRFSSKGGPPGLRFTGAVESLPWWHERLRAVVILSCDGIDICERCEDREGTVIYADPPYLVKGAKYVHDFTGEHHRRLAAALGRFKLTRVVVSYYEHPDIESLYPGWRKLEVRVAKSMVNTGKRTEGRTEAPEVLLVNGEIIPQAKENGRG